MEEEEDVIKEGRRKGERKRVVEGGSSSLSAPAGPASRGQEQLVVMGSVTQRYWRADQHPLLVLQNTSSFCCRRKFRPFFLSRPKVVSKQVQQASQARGSRSASESQGSWALLRKFSKLVASLDIHRGRSLTGGSWPLASATATDQARTAAEDARGMEEATG